MPRTSATATSSVMDLSGLQWHDGQLRICQSVRDSPVTTLAAGRRWGKSSTRKLVTIDRIRRSNGFTEGCIGAHSHAEAKNMWEGDLLAFGPWICDKANEDQRRFLEFRTGIGDAESRAEGFDSRGCRVWYPALGDEHKSFQAHGLFWAILDEMALLGTGAWDDTIAPMLLDNDGHALLYGNAYPEGPNFAGFSEIWQRGNPKNHPPCGDPACEGPHRDPRYSSSSGASWENPFGKIAAGARIAYEAMVARGQVAKARCLFMGEFATDIGAVFTNLDEVFSIRATQIEPGLWWNRGAQPYESVVIGIDFGKHDDKTVVVVLSLQTLEMLALLRIDRTDYLYQLPIIDRLIRRFQRRQIWSEGRDETAAELLRKMYGDAVNLVKLTRGGRFDKGALVERGMDYCQRGAWRLIDAPWLKEEFRLFERTKTPKGHWEYSAAKTGHDDGVLACLHAIYGLPLLPTIIHKPKPVAVNHGDIAAIEAMFAPRGEPRRNVFSLRRGW